MENMQPQSIDNDLRFSVVYRIHADGPGDCETIARDIAIEQTVETPLACVPEQLLKDGTIGRIENITPVIDKENPSERAGFDATISFRCDITGFTVPQFLNLIFGNISLKNNIRIVGFDFPEAFLRSFPGPSHGIDGIRKALSIWDRPLACTALKPLGLCVPELASMAGAFARGGIDVIKDDHGLGNQPMHPFEERVAHVAEAVADGNAATGGRTMYCPMISGRFDEIERQIRCVLQAGLKGILIAPMLVGFDTVRYISEMYNLVIIAHPSLTGTFFSNKRHGMTPAAMLGTLFRLIGADLSVFPNAGGRFCFTQKECSDLAAALTSPLGHIKPSLPCPAGGMSLERIKELWEAYGNDVALLVGGSLMQHSPDLTASTRIFMEAVKGLRGPARRS
jgi:ribulose-bisphosphate carboxylase large chain